MSSSNPVLSQHLVQYTLASSSEQADSSLITAGPCASDSYDASAALDNLLQNALSSNLFPDHLQLGPGPQYENEGQDEDYQNATSDELPLLLQSAAYVIPHPSKREKGGEDSYFIADTGRAVGIADGVGGWAELGVDPAIYANLLMEAARRCAEESRPHEEINPISVLWQSYNKAKEVRGSSTACIITLNSQALVAANLGDSGFMIIRNNQIVFRTKEMQHAFNFPFQLGSESTDTPDKANVVAFPVQEGDIVVMGTDGLFDNLFDEDVLDIVKGRSPADIDLTSAVREHENACGEATPMDTSDDSQHEYRLAKLVACCAHAAAKQTAKRSPFSVAATANGFLWSGGKLDDVCVVVSKVIANKKEAPAPVHNRWKEVPLVETMDVNYSLQYTNII